MQSSIAPTAPQLSLPSSAPVADAKASRGSMSPIDDAQDRPDDVKEDKTKRRSSKERRKSKAKAARPARQQADAAPNVRQIASTRCRQEAHRDARLSVKQASIVLDLCAREIKMRGLATVGIFRPFRPSESQHELERLIELFLLASAPETYESIFVIDASVLSNLFADAFGKKDADTEFRRTLAYANMHDVVALFKWALRRLDLQANDLGPSGKSSYEWYEHFAKREREAAYPLRAFSEHLLEPMAADAAKVFCIVFDVMSTIAAHHVANAMSAWRLCRILGYWFVGRIDAKNPTDISSTFKLYTRASQVTEHLLLAYIRDESAQYHLMPSRLTELIQPYPSFSDASAGMPSLPRAYAAPISKALCVETCTTNTILTPKCPRRSPRKTLAAALKARGSNIESSEDVDDWIAIRNLFSVTASGRKSTEALEILLDEDRQLVDTNPAETLLAEMTEADLARQEALILKEDDSNVLETVAEVLRQRNAVFESNTESPIDSDNRPLNVSESDGRPISSHDSFNSLLSSPAAATHLGSRNAGSTTVSPSSHASSRLKDLKGSSNNSRKLGVLSEDADGMEDALDWSSFKASGFAASTSQVDEIHLDPAFRPKTELERAFEESDRQGEEVRRRSSRPKGGLRALRRRVRNPSMDGEDQDLQNVLPRGPPEYLLESVSTIPFDDCFALLWQDQLLDDCPTARLPHMLCAQLQRSVASRLLGSSMGSSSMSSNWLVLSETIIPPRPPPPPTTKSSLARPSSMLFRRSSRGAQSDASIPALNENNVEYDDSDRHSTFSVRSGFSTRLGRRASITKLKGFLSRSNRSTTEVNGFYEGAKDGTAHVENGMHTSGDSSAWTSLDPSMSKAAQIDAEVRELQAVVSAARLKQSQEVAERERRKAERHEKEEQQRMALADALKRGNGRKASDGAVSGTAAAAAAPTSAIAFKNGNDTHLTSSTASTANGAHARAAKDQNVSAAASPRESGDVAASVQSHSEQYRSNQSSPRSRYVDAQDDWTSKDFLAEG